MELEVMRLSTFPLSSSDLQRASQLRVIMASLFCCQDCGELLLEMSCRHRTRLEAVLHYTPEWSTLIGRATSRLCSDWLES